MSKMLSVVEFIRTAAIDRPSGSDQRPPPAGLAGDRVSPGDELIEGQGVADQDRVGARLVEDAIGTVGDLQPLDRPARIERQRHAGRECHQAAAFGGRSALKTIRSFFVMAGLDPAIHVSL